MPPEETNNETIVEGTDPVAEVSNAEPAPTAAVKASVEETPQMAPNEPFNVSEDKLFERNSAQPKNSIRDLLPEANQVRQEKIKAKLEKIMTLFNMHHNITNNQVEHLLHVSDATATRYLDMLEHKGIIKQSTKTGKGVFYEKI